MRISDWSSDVCSSDLTKVEAWMVNDVFPWIGSRRAGDLEAPDFLAAVRRVESRGAIESAHRIQIGRAACRERVCQYVSVSVVAASLKKKRNNTHSHCHKS